MKARFVFCWVGRTSAEYARVAEKLYLGRIRRYREARILVVAEERQGGRYSREHRLEREGERILDKLDGLDNPFVMALDPRGKQLGSRSFAARIRDGAWDSGRPLVIVVGGPDGLSSHVRERADRLLGLSQMTLPHDLARIVILEQTYRALTILHRHPYDR